MQAARKPLLAVLVLLICNSSVAAEEPPFLASGARIRVRLLPTKDLLGYESQERSEFQIVGTFERWENDTLQLSHSGVRRQFPITAVTKIEVSHGRYGHTGWGALFGLGVGVVGGVISGLVFCEGDCSGEGGDFTPAVVAVLGLGGGLAGTGLGALVGSFIRTERWRTVPLASEHHE